MAENPPGVAERAARNEDQFREINESIEETNASHRWFNPSMPNWVCECANLECSEPVPMTVEEYQAVRSNPTHFLAVPSPLHVVPDIERVVARDERYWIVEKIGEAAEVATDLDESGATG